MPQRTQNCLIHSLLLWTTIISIIQIVIIILLFTGGHKSLDNSAVEPSKMAHVGTVNSFPVLSKGKMLTFKAIKAEGQIKWTSSRSDDALIKEDKNGLTMQMDGYYFLNLQISLSTECKGLKNRTVSMTNSKNQVFLEGSINKETCSTGILSKVVELGAGEELAVNIGPSVEHVDDSESKTHLDIIFMERL